MKKQFSLNLGYRTALDRDDFFVWQGNSEAVTWIDRWPDWPVPCCIIFGPHGCGKSHLVQVFAEQTKGVVLSADEIIGGDAMHIAIAAPAVAIDDADVTQHLEVKLLHLFNALMELGHCLLLTAQSAPSRWNLSLPDLRSRLCAAPSIRIAPPNDSMMDAVLVKLFADRQLSVSPEAITYIVRHIDRTFEAARNVVEASDRVALEKKGRVTVPLLKSVIDEIM